jgi:hypothetical protein
MLIPQFSLRWMLAVTTVLAVVFLIVAQAVQGAAWAVGVSFGVFALVAAMLVFAGLFFLVWVFSVLFAPRSSPRQYPLVDPLDADNSSASPFAATSPLARPSSPPSSSSAGIA